MPREIMKVKEIAEYLGFSPTKVYRLIEANKIPAIKVGKQYRFKKSIIDDWLVENLITKESNPGKK